MTLSELFDKADEMVAKRYQDCNASIKEMNSYRDGYIHGMTEKLEGMIPIEKVCKWMEENLREVHPRTGEEVCIVNLNRFREAMED